MNWKNACIGLLLVAPVLAQTRDAVLLPVELPGYNKSDYSEMMTSRLNSVLQKQVSNAHVQVAHPAELTVYRYATTGQPPSPTMAEQLCAAYKTDYVCWVSVRFQPRYDAASHSLALAGGARLWIFGRNQRKAVVDEPISLLRNGPCPGQKEVATVAPHLAQQCLDDLGLQLSLIARSQARPRAAGSPAQPPQTGANYRQMVKLIETYRGSQRRGDIVSMSETDRRISSLYFNMTPAERTQVDQNYPEFARTPSAEGMGVDDLDWNLTLPAR